LIAANETRLGKTLWTDSNEDGEAVKVRGVWDGEEEARLTADDIEAHQRDGQKLNEMAVLVRASFQMREFEDRFISLGIPYRVIGGPRFYERAEIRDANAYFRLIAQIDDDLAFERICNKPRRGLGNVAMQTLQTAARRARQIAVPHGGRDYRHGRVKTGSAARHDRFCARRYPLALSGRYHDPYGIG
jgi:DNA helicase-2/ATP-dependent DNA helicase PcrA